MSTASDDTRHVPVMLAEVLAALAPRDGGTYVDGTFGAGGYTRSILDSADCSVFAIDRDANAIAAGREIEARYGDRLTLIEGRFSEMADLLDDRGVTAVDGVTLDLGVSSMQLDDAERGFSFRHDGPLDMRMEGRQSAGSESAADVVNGYEERDLARIIHVLGEERHARRIAKAIVKARQLKRFTRTGELADLISDLAGAAAKRDRIHPATRTFQALRIWVNRELDELADGLHAAEVLLRPGGRLAVVSFHSLEDRMVKRFLAARTGKTGGGSRHRPERTDLAAPSFIELGRGAAKPGDAEAAANPRARSARLRAATRTDAPAIALDPGAIGLPAVLAEAGRG
jgi:16S rRNA (cytosine1402-N4)-methyltransferase